MQGKLGISGWGFFVRWFYSLDLFIGFVYWFYLVDLFVIFFQCIILLG